ncbi:carbohydrate ABC transporter permease [Haloarcula hispanica]|uniref:Carbohydrate ABC transporter permease n=1 Tax=Haloarcula hispanica TaxID=51589 RepID=A0A5J5LDD1_HALHI|nr:carbohydrate ABC transporter permease [Haloarcula hispanica]KAA9404853.1 carbohydrate ABC transporter permease [Haloarcula hispanica]
MLSSLMAAVGSESTMVPDEMRLTADGKELVYQLLWRSVLILVLIFAIFPVWMMFTTSFKTRDEVLQLGLDIIPADPYVQNYFLMFQRFPLVDYYVNSLVISSVTTVLSLLIGGLAAYSLSRYKFPGKEKFEMGALATQMIPGVLILIPMFLLFIVMDQSANVPMKDTYHGMIFLYTTFTVPFTIWMLRGYFDTIPTALEEAARIDGCTRTQALFRVVMPLAAPGLAATGMFVFLLAFNEVLFASVLATDNVTPFSIGIQNFQQQDQTMWGQMMAASTLAAVPLLAIFVVFQRQIVSGLTSGSVKQ